MGTPDDGRIGKMDKNGRLISRYVNREARPRQVVKQIDAWALRLSIGADDEFSKKQPEK